MDLMDIYKSNKMCILLKNIWNILQNKTSLNKFKKEYMKYFVSSINNSLKLEINYKKFGKNKKIKSAS